MVSGQELLSETSLSQVTTGIVLLSASSVTTNGSGAGTSAEHCTYIVAGLLAVGKTASPTVKVCVTKI